jgi:hypothetical protein
VNIKSVIILISAIIIAGCGLFDTRTPEDPVNSRSTFLPPTSPDAVLSNLTYSISQKNSNNYDKCISDLNFIYTPDSKSALTYGSIFQYWNKNSEMLYYQNLIAQTNTTASSNLFISNKEINLIASDSAIVTADYIVVYQHNKANLPKSSTGNVKLTITADESNNFYIKKWEDYRKNDTDFTWSELKANFSN